MAQKCRFSQEFADGHHPQAYTFATLSHVVDYQKQQVKVSELSILPTHAQHSISCLLSFCIKEDGRAPKQHKRPNRTHAGRRARPVVCSRQGLLMAVRVGARLAFPSMLRRPDPCTQHLLRSRALVHLAGNDRCYTQLLPGLAR